MSYTLSERGIVLRSYDYGQGHRVVVIFTENCGKLRAVAKGSRKTKSRFGSKLEPFSRNEFLFYRKPAGVLYTITGCSPLQSNEGLREDMRRYSYAALMAEGVDLLTADEDPGKEIYSLFVRALSQTRNLNPAPVAWLFLFRLLKLCGYRLNMFACAACGRKAGERMVFIPAEGSIGCRDCFREEKNTVPITSGALEVIKKLNPERKIAPRLEKEIGNVVGKFVKYQFSRDFKSFEFLSLFSNKGKKCIFKN